MTPKKAKFVKAKLLGKTNTEAALEAGAKTEVAARKYASRMSQDVTVQNAVHYSIKEVLDELELNLMDAVKPIKEALTATKLMVHGKNSEESWVDEVPDHAIRLTAAKQLRELLPKQDELPPNPLEAFDPNMDEVELARIYARKS